jgi:hypothetical protein
VGVSVLALAGVTRAQSLGTAFTYQGELRSGTSPASGAHDLRFRLYDTQVGGAQQGTEQCFDNVPVADGRFTVALDFGSQFAGQQRFLEVDVRADTGLACIDPTGFVTLGPRQPLAAAPYALFAANAGAAGTATSATTATTATTATNATQLNGQAGSFYQDAANLVSGVLTDARLSGNVALRNAENAFTAVRNTFSGKVGIGVADPQAALEVQGDIIRTIARVQGYNQGDNTDVGPLAFRLLNFTKRHNDTGLRVTYSDNIRVLPANRAGRWEIRFNGASATPFPLAWDRYVESGNTHTPTTFVGTAFNLPAGAYVVRVYVGPSPGYAGVDLYTGWQGAWSLEVEEVR